MVPARPILPSLVLLVLAVLSVVYLTRAISRGTETVKQVVAVSGGSEGEPPAMESGNSGARSGRFTGLSWRWNPQSLFTLLLLGVAVFFLVESTQFRYPHTRFAPYYLSIAMIAAVAVQLVGEGFSRKGQGEIMDLGMRSGTGRTAFRKLLVVVAWLAGLVIASAIIGLPYAAIAFGFGFALAFGPRGGPSCGR